MSNAPILGIKNNLGQFSQQLIQVFFVGLMIGMERNIIPAFAEDEFGVAHDSFLLLTTFVMSFGFVKAAMNFIAGRMSERFGRKQVLLWGWMIALPIPFMLAYAPNWWWVVAANVLLGMNQGFAWSMTVTAKADIAHAHERGLATGFNEFAGYGGVAIASIVTGYLVLEHGVRDTLLEFGIAVVFLALMSAYLFTKETQPWAEAEAKAHRDGTHKGPKPRFPKGVASKPTSSEIFKLVSYQNPTFAALSQAGMVEKFVDALVWAFYPLYLTSMGLSIVETGWVVGTYGLVWGASQLWTGPLSDKFGRKGPIVAGMWICGAGVAMTVMGAGMVWWLCSAAVAGVGMALLYPTLIAGISDISHPDWRGSSLGVYRFWRDGGYGVGAIMIGLVAQATGRIEYAFMFTALAMFFSGLYVLVQAEETHPHINPDED